MRTRSLNGARRENLLRRIRRAVTEWMKQTAEGAEAWRKSMYDFNIADLENHLTDDTLKALLERQEVRDLEVETHCDISSEDAFGYDDILRENA